MNVRNALLAAACAVAFGGQALAQTTQLTDASGIRTIELNAQGVQLEPATYLGIATSSVPVELREQLQLKPGMGLIVEHVDRGSPADQAGLKQYDILQKFNDQLLVNPEQLAILVRLADAGSEVSLAVVRHGQPVTASAKLIEKSLPPLLSEREALAKMQNWSESGSGPARYAEGRPFPWMVDVDPAAPLRVTTNVDQTVLSIVRDKGTMHLTVTDGSGKIIFDGDVHSVRDLQGLPPRVLERIHVLGDQMNVHWSKVAPKGAAEMMGAPPPSAPPQP